MVKKDDLKTAFSERLRAACLDAGVAGRGLSGRIREAMKSQGIEISDPGVWKWLNGAAIPDSTNILALSRWLGVRPEWLEYGRREGDPAPSPNYSTIKDTGLKTVIWEDLTDEERSGFIQIPLLDVSLSAGHGMCALEERSDFSMPFDPRYIKSMGVSESAAKLVRVSGQSMSPALSDGDIVGVNTNDIEIRDGKTYAICQADLLRVKMLIATPDSVIIRSINREEYPDEVIPRDKFHDEVRVIGKVFWSAHSW